MDAWTARWRCRASALTAIVLVVLVLLQIYLGALVAGLDAGLTFNTWPLIDGAFIPAADRLWFEMPWWRNLFENALIVQFNHRMMAYLLAVVVILHAIDVLRSVDHHDAMAGALTLVALVGIQAAIGILTLCIRCRSGSRWRIRRWRCCCSRSPCCMPGGWRRSSAPR